jgi:hypothetical protein
MKKIDKEKITDIYYRIAGIHIDLEELQGDEVDDLTHTFSHIAYATESLKEYCEKHHIDVS